MKILTLIVAAAIGLTASAGPVYTIIDMGTMGGSQTSGTAINQFGQVTGYGVDASGNLRAFTSGSTPGDITPGWANGGAAGYGINASGQVAGVSYQNGHAIATSWTNGTAQALGGLGGPDSYATAINGSGVIAGSATNAAGQGRAVVYSNGQTRDIGPSGTIWSAAYGVNESGTVAGYAMNGSGAFRGFIWSLTSGAVMLSTLGGANSYAFGINDSGMVAGNSTSGTGYAHAAMWGASGVTDLGTLGGNSSYAYGINNWDRIVGYSYLAGNTTTHAFLFAGGVMMDLNALVANLGGWELTQAYGINDDGQIVGTGLLNGVEHAFRLDSEPAPLGAQALPVMANPEPGTIALLVTGLGLLIGGRFVNRSMSRVD